MHVQASTLDAARKVLPNHRQQNSKGQMAGARGEERRPCTSKEKEDRQRDRHGENAVQLSQEAGKEWPTKKEGESKRAGEGLASSFPSQSGPQVTYQAQFRNGAAQCPFLAVDHSLCKRRGRQSERAAP